MDLIIQLAGAFGMVLCVLCYQFKTQKKLLFAKFFADIFWAIHYFVLGAVSGFIINSVCAVREMMYIFDENQKRRKIWLCFFLVINWLFSILFVKGFWSIIPTVASTIAAYSFWQKKVKVTRVLAIVVSFLMLIYDIFVKSYVGLVNECFTLISLTIALIRCI